MTITVQVYVSAECWSCEETQRIVAELAPQFPSVAFELVDTAITPLPDELFAVPTYLLNGRIISLGNPTRDDLRRRLARLLQPARAGP